MAAQPPSVGRAVELPGAVFKDERDRVIPVGRAVEGAGHGDLHAVEAGAFHARLRRVEPGAQEEAGAFCRGLAPVKTDGKWGFIDEKGTEIVSPTFLFASPLSNDGTAWVQNEAGFALLSFYYLSEEE